jgi:hypothetical protein
MMGPQQQGRRGADHFALLGLTEVANRKTGDGEEAPSGPRKFVGASLTPLQRPGRQALRADDAPTAQADDAPMARLVTKEEERAALRKSAATLLTDASAATKTAVAPVPAEQEKLSPFAMAAMLLLAGIVFLMVIPPVGVTFLLCAVLPIIWGAGSAVLKSPS